VYVHRDNPLKQLTLQQVEAVFGKNRRRGYKTNIATWGELGLTGDWANRPISMYGRNSASGTYGFFKEHVLQNGDFKDTVKEQPGSASVVQGITGDRYAIGYSGIGYRTSGVRAVPLAETEKGPYSDGKYADLVRGTYPLSRFLYLYINKPQGKPLDPLVAEFVKLIFTKEGQEVVVKDGYDPLSAAVAKQELGKIGVGSPTE
jgi:phosphate transport system substrate-binding protein